MKITCLACGKSKEVDDTPKMNHWWNEERGQVCKSCLDSLDATVMETV